MLLPNEFKRGMFLSNEKRGMLLLNEFKNERQKVFEMLFAH